MEAADAPRILVVDDEQVIREVLADFLAMEGFAVRTASDGNAALTELSKASYDLVLSDLKMPQMGGLELLSAIHEHMPDVVTIIMTGFGTVETAINAMKRGAYDYLLKPFKMQEVVQTVQRGLEKGKLRAENMRLKEALSLYKVSEAIRTSLSLDEVLATFGNAAFDEVDADEVVVYLKDGEGGFAARRRWGTHQLDTNVDAVAAHFKDELPLLVHGKDSRRFHSSERDVESMVATHLHIRNEMVGFLVAVSWTPRKRFVEAQRKLLRVIASRTSASIENAKLYEDLQATFTQTINGLASAIDKMDRYTAGHSGRVASYAQILAIKLGMDDAEVEIVRQSALMHDIGKIGCVMNLNKPGKLSQAEYEVFKEHPDFGRDILEPIEFLHPLIPGVHLHHERWDGSGYPLGLAKENIPVMARIISVADTYDAMTSDRAYRKALPHEVAINEITRCTGTQFDPDISKTFQEVIAEYQAK